MKLQIISASAGTGKTTELARILGEAIAKGEARPDAIVATTFTKQAAAELQNRARKRLLEQGQAQAAQGILAARIGTVNAVCGSFVTDFAFELGLCPELRVLDESAAELELQRALSFVVTEQESDELGSFKGKFDREFNWQFEVRRLIEAARANGIEADGMASCAQRSVASLAECLGSAAPAAQALDQTLAAAIERTLKDIVATGDSTGVTAEYVTFLQGAQRDLSKGRLCWGHWAALSKKAGGAKTRPFVGALHAAAQRHVEHPRMRADMQQLIEKLFDVAARGMAAFAKHKLELGVMDYVDQEVLALQLLSRSDIADALQGQLDLVLVDEFQDTSPLQLTIFLRLAALAKQSVWVGDTKQAIFGFRGTDPALMDAAMESLSSPARDPDLVDAAIEAVTRRTPVRTLSDSYRSRPELVDLTNAVFEAAFCQSQHMPRDRVRLKPVREADAALGPAVSHWPMLLCKNKEQDAAGIAAGVKELLREAPLISDRALSMRRPCRAGDVAVLCRTNEQCTLVAEALGCLGVNAVVARVGLLQTAEAQVLMAGLALWVDPRDTLAAATLLRIVEYPVNADAFADFVFGENLKDRLAAHAVVDRLCKERQANPDRDVPAVVDLAMEVLCLPKLCAAWGQSVQRTANLDEFRAHAVRYCNKQLAGMDAPSTVGFIAYLSDLLPSGGVFNTKRADACARVGGDDAVTVSTWHASKGLEWPVVVLGGLENKRAAAAYGVHVLSERKEFDINDPLGGRWIHFWPNPYHTANQGGPVKDAYARSGAHTSVEERSKREALRVLYVGWTRARDRLVFAARSGKLLDGILSTFTEIDSGIVSDPGRTEAGAFKTMWAKHAFDLNVAPQQPTEGEPSPVVPGSIRIGRGVVVHPPARLSPSNAPPRSYVLGQSVTLGPVVKRTGGDVAAVGSAIHAFLAADRWDDPVADRNVMAEGLLNRWGVADAMEAAGLVEVADRLWRWVKATYPRGVCKRELPLGQMLANGTHVMGTADLIVESPEVIAIVDHKSFATAVSAGRSEALGAQLGAYRDVVAKAKPGREVKTWVHLPLGGVMVEVS